MAVRRQRVLALAVALALAWAVPAAQGAPRAPGDQQQADAMAAYMRQVLARTRDPAAVAAALDRRGASLLGYQEVRVWLAPGSEGRPEVERATVLTADALGTRTSGQVEPAAGRREDFVLRQWLYEWQNGDGTWTEQNVVTGQWLSTEYWWLKHPDDVLDLRWVVGDLVLTVCRPYDGVRSDRQTLGAADFLADDAIGSWTVICDFTPASSAVYGKVTNVFTGYTHTWLGWRLAVYLYPGTAGTTGSVRVSTDAYTWYKSTGLAIRIASGDAKGPAIAAR